MNRAERRQHKLGRAPVVVAVREPGSTRVRKVTPTTRRMCASVIIDAGRPEDSKFVVKLMQDHFVKTGNPPITIDPASPMLIARKPLTGEPLAMLSCKPIPPGKVYVENFLAVPGRWGKIAARALAERIMEMTVRKVCLVEASNEAMLRVLEHYGGRVVGYIVEGPYNDAGAPQVAVAAAPSERVIS